MKNIKGKIYIACVAPVIPVAFLIDLAVGDLVVGIKSTTKEKFMYHIQIIKETWVGKDD